jgi:hypothetical protein
MDKYIESALINVCKSTLSNNVLKYRRTAKHYNFIDKAIAQKVMCNGRNIIDFAQDHGAYKTAARLKRSISRHVTITDIAMVEKLNVNFSL